MGVKNGLKLGFILHGVGRGWDSWRHPEAVIDGSTNIDLYVKQAKIAEKGKFDFVFVADSLHIDERSMPHYLSRFEPATILSALAMVTQHIGLVGTFSVSYTEPFNLARQFASLDKLSRGRAGWNVVTSWLEGTAANFSRDHHIGHGERYRLANEYVQVVKGLWDSYEPGAIVGDKQGGVFLKPGTLHQLNHKGEFFSVRGPLNLDRMPQGHPVLFQAGNSDDGRAFAAANADAIFSLPRNKEAAFAYRADLRERTAAAGRDPDTLFVFGGISTIVGSTREEVQRLSAERNSYASIEGALLSLGQSFNDYDFSQHDLDAPFPAVKEEWLSSSQGNVKTVLAAVEQDKLTLRETALRFGKPMDSFEGSPEEVADQLQDWFESGAVDGFMLGESLPGQFEIFVEQVVPILQARGLFRSDYSSDTLRGHLGLAVPENRYVAQRHNAAETDVARKEPANA
ncbi:monooxygenase [Sphingobium sp. TA15]|uniref:Putative monooxygenase n=1 Tax=Sphingobium indicum (strain DSM 16413 / CCM 7287 / MTCC 6362 / UT26 / NBRC 101211 / UT26S) TaxID=452662 RepID=D4YX83_SPHIU|nr:LLM class flavin-dependent oxidoreductase [Sphingobium indicum]BAI94965.1 putative monooxygenase [Sphingobium indicum UT26S]BDD67851.1 monooxygenase [Sphingobium sp. TA15]